MTLLEIVLTLAVVTMGAWMAWQGRRAAPWFRSSAADWRAASRAKTKTDATLTCEGSLEDILEALRKGFGGDRTLDRVIDRAETKAWEELSGKLQLEKGRAGLAQVRVRRLEEQIRLAERNAHAVQTRADETLACWRKADERAARWKRVSEARESLISEEAGKLAELASWAAGTAPGTAGAERLAMGWEDVADHMLAVVLEIQARLAVSVGLQPEATPDSVAELREGAEEPRGVLTAIEREWRTSVPADCPACAGQEVLRQAGAAGYQALADDPAEPLPEPAVCPIPDRSVSSVSQAVTEPRLTA